MRALTSLTLFAVALSLALPARAAEIAPILKGSELHRNAVYGGDSRRDVWRLAPDGTLTGNYRVQRPATASYYTIEGAVSGRWSVQNNALCVEAEGLEGDVIEGNGVQRICFDVRKAGFGQNEYVATNTASGANWQIFIYPGQDG